MASRRYRAFEGTSTRMDVDDIFAALEANGDVALHTARAHVIGYVCARLGRLGRLGRTLERAERPPARDAPDLNAHIVR